MAGPPTITVAPIDLSGNPANITVTRTFTNGSSTRLTYDLAGNQLSNSAAGLGSRKRNCTSIRPWVNHPGGNKVAGRQHDWKRSARHYLSPQSWIDPKSSSMTHFNRQIEPCRAALALTRRTGQASEFTVSSSGLKAISIRELNSKATSCLIRLEE